MSRRRSRILGGLAAGSAWILLLGVASASAEEKKPQPAGGPYGWQVMTEEEQAAYRDELAELETPESRATYRVEHRQKMNARALEQGIDISGRSGPSLGAGDARGRGGRAGGQGRGGQGRAGQRQGGTGRPVGWELMSEEERAAYKKTVQGLETREERSAFREEHLEKMEARAAEQSVTLQTPDTRRPQGRGQQQGGADRIRIYGEQLMTEKEREEYAEKVRGFKTLEERQEFREDHVVEMKRRAAEKGVKLPPVHAARPSQREPSRGAPAEGDAD